MITILESGTLFNFDKELKLEKFYMYQVFISYDSNFKKLFVK